MNTKDKIIYFSISLFSEYGYNGTSISDIAKMVGLTKASLYSHFESKLVIFEECLRLVARKQEDSIYTILNDQTLDSAKLKLQRLLEECSTNVGSSYYVFNYRFLYFPDPEIKDAVDSILQRSLIKSNNMIKDVIENDVFLNQTSNQYSSDKIFVYYSYLLNGITFDKNAANNVNFIWTQFWNSISR